MKLEIGKWYKNKEWSSSKDFAKASFGETCSIGGNQIQRKNTSGKSCVSFGILVFLW